jgi:hypothetical protein
MFGGAVDRGSHLQLRDMPLRFKGFSHQDEMR